MTRFTFASCSIVALAALGLPSCASKRPPPLDDVGGGAAGGSGGGSGGGATDGGTSTGDGGTGCGIATFVGAFVPQRTVHVTPQGNDSNDGTLASPWRSLKNAATRLQAGDLVLVADGTYPCAFEITTQGTASTPVVIRAEHAGLAVFECGSDVGIAMLGARYVALDGVVVRGAPGDLVRLVPTTTGAAPDHIVLQGTRLESNGGVALRVIRATQVDVIRSDISRQASAPADPNAGGVDILASNGVRFVTNRFRDYPANLAFQARAGSENVLVDGNSFTNVSEAVRLGGASQAADFAAPGVAQEIKTSQAVNNLVYGTVGVAFEAFGCDGCLIANNTTYLQGAQAAVRAAPGGAAAGVTGGSHTQNLRLLQNIFAFTQTTPQRLLDMPAGEIGGFNQARNLYFSTGGSVSGVRSDPPIDSEGTVVDQDPRFQDVSKQAFNVLPGSPALERGKPISEVTRDGYGACRTVQNLGAF